MARSLEGLFELTERKQSFPNSRKLTRKTMIDLKNFHPQLRKAVKINKQFVKFPLARR